jgi:hypothetical protein
MCKRIILIVVATVSLVLAQNLIAQENPPERRSDKETRSRTEFAERQAATWKELAEQAKNAASKWAEQSERFSREAAKWAERAEIEWSRMRESPEREAAQKQEQAERKEIKRAERGDLPKVKPPARMEEARPPVPQMAPGQMNRLQERFGMWLDELTKAYKDNDRERMGQLIRKMHQFRKRLQQQRADFRSANADWWAFRGGQARERIQPPAIGEFRGGPGWPGRGNEDRGLDMPGRGFRRGRADLPGPLMQQPPSMRRPIERPPDDVVEPPIGRGPGRLNQPITPQNPLGPNRPQSIQPPEEELN